MTHQKTNPVVAVVDDDPRLIESVADLFESAGYAAYGYPSAEALLASGISGHDALIADIGMPGMSGFELRDLVRKLRPELPVFLITGRHELAEQARAVRGADAGNLFRKPFDAMALLAAVDGAVRRRNRGDRA